MYYRKQLSSNQSRNDGSGGGFATLLLAAIGLAAGVSLITWLIDNPVVLAAGIAVAISVLVGRWLIGVRKRKLLAAYKQALDSIFVSSSQLPTGEHLTALRNQQQRLPNDEASKRALRTIETDVYRSVLDRVLDDGRIGDQEAAAIVVVEQVVRLDSTSRLRTKKEIFAAAYMEAIEDRGITEQELDKLTNLMVGLAIPASEVERELKIVREILKAQDLSLPLEQIPRESLAAPIQKSERAFHQCSAQVLSKRRSKDSQTGYEYTVKREGTMILTNKRVFVVGDGTTNVRFSEIGDIDVDIDEGLVEITKSAVERPIILKTDTPIYTGRVIDLLVNADAGDSTHGGQYV